MLDELGEHALKMARISDEQLVVLTIDRFVRQLGSDDDLISGCDGLAVEALAEALRYFHQSRGGVGDVPVHTLVGGGVALCPAKRFTDPFPTFASDDHREGRFFLRVELGRVLQL